MTAPGRRSRAATRPDRRCGAAVLGGRESSQRCAALDVSVLLVNDSAFCGLEPLLAVKQRVDRDRARGQLLLTGLANYPRSSSSPTWPAPPSSPVASYLALLEALFLVVQVPAFATSATTRAKRRSKTLITDPGLAAHLTGAGPAAFGPSGDGRLAEALFETTVLTEIATQATGASTSSISRIFGTATARRST